MAFANVGTFITDGNKTAGTSRTVASSTTIEVDNLAVLAVSCDNLTTTDGNTNDITSVTDVRGNTWTKALEYTNGNSAAGAGITVAFFYCVPTTQITAGDNITVNFSGTVTAKALKGSEFTKGAGTTISIDGTGQEAVDAGDPGSITLTGANSGEHLWIRAVGGATATTTLSASAGYSRVNATASSGGASDTNAMVGWEFKISTGTGSGASNPTCTTADWASVMVGLIEVANNTSAIPVASISLAGNAISGTTTERHFSALPVAAVAVAGAAVSAATTEKHFSAIPAAAVSLAGSTVSATTTEKHFSAIPVAAVSVAGLAPGAATTERNFSAIEAKAIAVASNAIGATTTTGSANDTALPAAAVSVASNAIQATTTEHHTSAIQVKAVTLAGAAIAAATTENHTSSIPVAAVVLASLAVQTTTTEHHVSALPAGAIGLASFAIRAETTFTATRDDKNPLFTGSDSVAASTRPKDMTSAGPDALQSGRQSNFRCGPYD